MPLTSGIQPYGAVYGRGILCVPLTWGFACLAWRERGARGAPGGCDAGGGAGRLLNSGSCRAFGVRKAKSALALGDCGLPHHATARSGALFAMQDTPWDHGLTVTADAEGLVGHAGGVILREMADRSGLTAALKDALARGRGGSPSVDRGVAMVSAAVMIALGGTSMSDVSVLGHLSRVLGEPVTWQTLRRTLYLACLGTMGEDRAGQGEGPRARVGAASGKAGRVPAVGDRGAGPGGLDRHRHGRHPDHRALAEGKGRGHVQVRVRLPPARLSGARTPARSLAMELRPGNAGVEHRRRPQERAGRRAGAGSGPVSRGYALVRLDGAGASHGFVEHMMTFEIPGGRLLFTSGWTITETDENDIRQDTGRGVEARR